MILIKGNRTHLKKENSHVSACGHAPWLKPVTYEEGTIGEITCKHCQYILEIQQKEGKTS